MARAFWPYSVHDSADTLGWEPILEDQVRLRMLTLTGVAGHYEAGMHLPITVES